nr:nucleotidyltransferase family protein [Herbiconiux sp. VKM Ac-1786]
MLLAALVSRRAEERGIRILVVKGLVLEQLGLRARRNYADVDVIVEPAHAEDLVEAMGDVGWRPRTHYWVFDLLEQHSTTLMNDEWPVDLDVHRFFPGFLGEPEDVFEELWSHRQSFTLGNHSATGTDRAASAAIAGLHALRGMYTDRQKTEYSHLVDLLRADDELGHGVVELAGRTGSLETLRPMLEECDLLRGVPVNDSDALRAWKRRIAHRSRTGQWLTYLGSLPLRQRPAELGKIIWPPADLYVQEHPELAGSVKGLVAARVKRLAYGFKGLLTVRRSRRTL